METSVAFRAAKDAAFAERKATMRQLLISRAHPWPDDTCETVVSGSWSRRISRCSPPHLPPTGRNGAGPRGGTWFQRSKTCLKPSCPAKKTRKAAAFVRKPRVMCCGLARLGSMACSTPVVADGRLFIGSCDDRQGLFSCFDAPDGQASLAVERPARDVPKMMDGRQFQFNNFPRTLGVCSSAADRRRPRLFRQPAAGSPLPGRTRRRRREDRQGPLDFRYVEDGRAAVGCLQLLRARARRFRLRLHLQRRRSRLHGKHARRVPQGAGPRRPDADRAGETQRPPRRHGRCPYGPRTSCTVNGLRLRRAVWAGGISCSSAAATACAMPSRPSPPSPSSRSSSRPSGGATACPPNTRSSAGSTP